MLEAQQSQRVQRQCSGKQSAGKFGARPLRDEVVSSNAATAVAYGCSEHSAEKLARLGLKDSSVWTAPDITYRDAHKSTGRIGRLEEVHFPSPACPGAVLATPESRSACARASTRQQPRSTQGKAESRRRRSTGQPRARAASDARRGKA